MLSESARMKSLSTGSRFFIVILAIFLAYAACFILYQLNREREFKIELLNQNLQSNNLHIYEYLIRNDSLAEELRFSRLDEQLEIRLPSLRITLIDPDGTVVYDNVASDVASLQNHLNRQEVSGALQKGHAYVMERSSQTLTGYFFYSATYFEDLKLVVRSALPYDHDLTETLLPDNSYIWFSLLAILVLTFFLWRFTNRLGKNIRKLKLFASRAVAGSNLDIEDLAIFPRDELGEIAERIIKIYKQLQTTKDEQDVLKRQLTQNIAHELKTPVASIQGYLETILNSPNIDEATKQQFLQRCYAQSERLGALLKDISALNRMSEAPEAYEFETLNISEIVQQIADESFPALLKHQMQFTNKLPTDISIKGNRQLLYSVFRNLTDNAIAYAGDGTTITITATEQEAYWQFEFKDNGIGVAARHLPRLFERFYRVDKGRSRRMGGTGLGLAIVKNAVLLHGGTIEARRAPGSGLSFVFTIKKGI